MNNRKKIIVVSTIIDNRKLYVSNHPVPCEGGRKWAVMHTQVPEDAKEFKAKGLAQDFASKIKNPFGRVYMQDMVEVDIHIQQRLLKSAAEEVLQ